MDAVHGETGGTGEKSARRAGPEVLSAGF